MNKTKEEQNKLLQEFLTDQKTYNETGDKDLLWNKMYPYLYDCALSLLKKKLKGIRLRYSYEEVAQSIAISLVARYIKKQSYNKDKPLTMVYYRMIDELYNKGAAYQKEEAINYDLNNYNIWNEKLAYTTFEDDVIDKLTEEGY